MSRGKMCEALRQVRRQRQRQRHNLRRRLKTHKGRTGHVFVRDVSQPKGARICKKCGKGY